MEIYTRSPQQPMASAHAPFSPSRKRRATSRPSDTRPPRLSLRSSTSDCVCGQNVRDVTAKGGMRHERGGARPMLPKTCSHATQKQHSLLTKVSNPPTTYLCTLRLQIAHSRCKVPLQHRAVQGRTGHGTSGAQHSAAQGRGPAIDFAAVKSCFKCIEGMPSNRLADQAWQPEQPASGSWGRVKGQRDAAMPPPVHVR